MTESALSLRPLRSHPRSLQALAEVFGIASYAPLDSDLSVKGITMSTADVRAGDIFVGLPGQHVHGASFSLAAREAGAVAIITDATGAAEASLAGLPVLVAPKVREILGELAAWVYQTAEDAPIFYGVTGTNGKTSVVYLLSALLESLGVRSGLSSTAERRIGNTAIVSQLTTPEATEMHALLARMKEDGVAAVALEVSAQAMTRHRVDGIFFDVVGFANLSHDHLDDYETFEDYFAAKAELFTHERARRGVVMVDTAWGQKLASAAKIPITTVSTLPSVAADWQVMVVARSARSTTLTITSTVHQTSPAESLGHPSAPESSLLTMTIPLLGDFMAANAALAVIMLVESGYSLADIATALDDEGALSVFIPGRAEVVSGPAGPVFYVDYGHTPDAFESILSSLRKVTPGKVVMVFGADGDRDKTKRGDMGMIAARGADVVIITDYHPRTEVPGVIRAQLLEGARRAVAETELFEIADPAAAIRFALTLVGDGDAVLYAGPGHENYREVAGQHVDYDARNDVRSALREAGWLDSKAAK